jgi:hypothetical protein
MPKPTPAMQRLEQLRAEAQALDVVVKECRAHLQQIREAVGTSHLDIVCDELEAAIAKLPPRYNAEQHQMLREQGYATAAEWLQEHTGSRPTPAAAASLTHRTLAYLVRLNDGVNPRYIDGFVVELLKASTVVTFFPPDILRTVHTYGWTPKNAVFAEAAFVASELLGDAPLRVPSFGASAGGAL